MKKLIFVLVAAAAFSCGDGSNRSSERENDLNNDANDRELVEPDTSGMTDDDMESDTTSTWDRDRDNQMESDSL